MGDPHACRTDFTTLSVADSISKLKTSSWFKFGDLCPGCLRTFKFTLLFWTFTADLSLGWENVVQSLHCFGTTKASKKQKLTYQTWLPASFRAMKLSFHRIGQKQDKKLHSVNRSRWSLQTSSRLHKKWKNTPKTWHPSVKFVSFRTDCNEKNRVGGWLMRGQKFDVLQPDTRFSPKCVRAHACGTRATWARAWRKPRSSRCHRWVIPRTQKNKFIILLQCTGQALLTEIAQSRHEDMKINLKCPRKTQEEFCSWILANLILTNISVSVQTKYQNWHKRRSVALVSMSELYNALVIPVWDTTGQEGYDRVRPMSYPNTHTFVLCYRFVNTKFNVTEKHIHATLLVLHMRSKTLGSAVCCQQGNWSSVSPRKMLDQLKPNRTKVWKRVSFDLTGGRNENMFGHWTKFIQTKWQWFSITDFHAQYPQSKVAGQGGHKQISCVFLVLP